MKLSPTAAHIADQAAPAERPTGPHPGALATIYVALFLAGLIVVSSVAANPSFPAPSSGPQAIVAYFQAHPMLIRTSAFLSFGAVLALAVLVACVVNRLRFLGIRSAWVDIALVVGLATALDQTASHLSEWALTWPGITQDRPVTLALYYLMYGFGGPGFSVPMGLFVGTLTLIAGRWSLLPTWMVVAGFVIAAIGIVSWLNLLAPTAPLLPLTIPLTRFPAFAWLILAGFILPAKLAAASA
jgi:hypothetical protein